MSPPSQCLAALTFFNNSGSFAMFTFLGNVARELEIFQKVILQAE